LSDENIEGYVSVAAADLKPGKNYFVLRVKGTSMIDAGIFDGDLALIEQRRDADNGLIVVAALEDGLTLKKFFRTPTKIKLVAANPDFPTKYYNDVRIAGVLVRIMRQY
jgi:repressor LexA